jgi:hypothetical protein
VKQIKRSDNFLEVFEQEDFTFSAHDPDSSHSHPGHPGLENLLVVYRDCKKIGAENQFTPAGDIISQVLKSQGPKPGSHLPDQANLKRVINLARAKDRPAPPKRDDKNFALNTEFFAKAFAEKFFIGEVKCGEERHLIFATKTQLTQLSRVAVWYVDGTFKIVDDPFCQLFTINGMLKNSQGSKIRVTFLNIIMKFIF